MLGMGRGETNERSSSRGLKTNATEWSTSKQPLKNAAKKAKWESNGGNKDIGGEEDELIEDCWPAN